MNPVSTHLVCIKGCSCPGPTAERKTHGKATLWKPAVRVRAKTDRSTDCRLKQTTHQSRYRTSHSVDPFTECGPTAGSNAVRLRLKCGPTVGSNAVRLQAQMRSDCGLKCGPTRSPEWFHLTSFFLHHRCCPQMVTYSLRQQRETTAVVKSQPALHSISVTILSGDPAPPQVT